MTTLKDYKVSKIEGQIRKLHKLCYVPAGYFEDDIAKLHAAITEMIVDLDDMHIAFRLFNDLHSVGSLA